MWRALVSMTVFGMVVAGAGYEVAAKRATRTMAMTLTRGRPDNAPRLLRRYGCVGCHTIPALPGADGKVGPPLDHLRQRVFIAGKLQNTPDNLVHWIASPESLDSRSAMPDTGITEPEARDVAAFLYAH